MSNTDLGTVLVTGGAGFIGCALSHAIADQVSRHIVLDSMHSQVHATPERPGALHPDAELVIGDVTDSDVWDKLLSDIRPDVVVHLAAETGTAQSLDESTRHAHVNVVGTTQMLDAFTRIGHTPRHILLSSSRAVYGEGTWQHSDGSTFHPGQRPHAQLAAGQWDFPGAHALPSSFATTPPAPTSVYGATKLAQEHILSAWTAARSVPLTILRLQNVYGPGQSLINSYTGIVSLFSQLAKQGKAIPLYEDGQITRDFVFIDDVAAAMRAALIRDSIPPLTQSDVGSGVPTTIAELAGTVAQFHGAPAPEVCGKFRDGDVRHAACDMGGTNNPLGLTPQWELDRGIAALQSWIDEQQTH